MQSSSPKLLLTPTTQLVIVEDPSPTISVLWDIAVQQAIINEGTGPTIGSRASALVHTAMFDAWAAYDPVAIATQLGDDLQQPDLENTDANKNEATSYAAYRVLVEIFPEQSSIFDLLMAELGYDPANQTTDVSTAAGIGNVSAEALMTVRRSDGSNQSNGYVNSSDYTSVNTIQNRVDITKWTRERVPIDAPSDSEADRIQDFLTPQWGQVIPFALDEGSQYRPTAPQPFFTDEYAGGLLNIEEQTILLPDGSVMDVVPNLVGEIINPEFIAQAERVVDASATLTDEQKLIAEFWEDGGGTSFPPGTWMTFGQFMSARDNHDLDTDIQLFFTLGNAVFDAGIGTWEAKAFYDYVRPVRAIRDLGSLGLIGELGTDEITGERGYVIDAWAGPGLGTESILAENFLTYQTPGSDPSPPFAEYTSGHSAFSAAGAEVLKLFSGSDVFGAEVSFQTGESRFEPAITPIEPVTLSWDTFSEAADEAAISRIYGGIHFDEGDRNGRQLGRSVASDVYDRAQYFINGGRSVAPTLDFEGRGLSAGTVISDQFTGMTISTDGLDAMLFDTDNVTGGDRDLASDYLGNVLILSEDGNSENPDDSRTGGTFEFQFDDLVSVENIKVLDVEEVGGSISLVSADGSILETVGITPTSNNGVGTIDIGVNEVSQMTVTLVGSGAIAEVNFV
ncbi:MAG: vanadium-dependent haloperoxidase [Cyanobacteria bacterium P01_E01_bin.34]